MKTPLLSDREPDSADYLTAAEILKGQLVGYPTDTYASSAAAQTPPGTPLRCRGQPRQANGGNRAGSWDCHGNCGAGDSLPFNLPLLPKVVRLPRRIRMSISA